MKHSMAVGTNDSQITCTSFLSRHKLTKWLRMMTFGKAISMAAIRVVKIKFADFASKLPSNTQDFLLLFPD